MSLVELMVVVAVVGILAAVAVPRIQTMMARSRQSEAKNNLSLIHSLQESYRATHDTYGQIDGWYGATNCFIGPWVRNDLGFTLGNCDKARYSYIYSPTGGGTRWLGYAQSGVGNNNKVVPGCLFSDWWVIDQDKFLRDIYGTQTGALPRC